MITFHPCARKCSSGFLPSVMLRGSDGRMVGSRVSQNGCVFATAEEALAHAMNAARRVVARHSTNMMIAG
jgi:hypothetical protein